MRTDLLPLTFGFPFGLMPAGAANVPLPTKIVTQVLDPIDPAEIVAEFGPDAEVDAIAEVDEVVRARMQEALDRAGAGAKVPGAGMTSARSAAHAALGDRSPAPQPDDRPMRPDRYVGMTRILRRYGPHATTGFALAANRRPDGIGLIDERGSLTWQRDPGARRRARRRPRRACPTSRRRRSPSCAATTAASSTRSSPPAGSACPACCSTPGSPAPQLADVLEREQATLIVYDEEFAGLVADARSRIPGLVEVLSWVDDESATHEQADDGAADRRPPRRAAAARTARAGRTPDVRHHRHAEGRQPQRRRPGGAGRDARADPVARRGDRRRRGADLPRVGLRAARHRGDDGVHDRAAPEVRPRGDPGAGRRAPGDRHRAWCP